MTRVRFGLRRVFADEIDIQHRPDCEDGEPKRLANARASVPRRPVVVPILTHLHAGLAAGARVNTFPTVECEPRCLACKEVVRLRRGPCAG
jgi:hypothetical protein